MEMGGGTSFSFSSGFSIVMWGILKITGKTQGLKSASTANGLQSASGTERTWACASKPSLLRTCLETSVRKIKQGENRFGSSLWPRKNNDRCQLLEVPVRPSREHKGGWGGQIFESLLRVLCSLQPFPHASDWTGSPGLSSSLRGLGKWPSPHLALGAPSMNLLNSDICQEIIQSPVSS